jgi:Ca-activated chloride channel family protein
MTRSSSILLLAAITAAPSLPTARIVVTGRVTDGATGVPLVSAQVSDSARRITVQTDSVGRYRLVLDATVPRGQALTLHARRIGYLATTRTVAAVTDSIVLDFPMTAAVNTLQEVVITGAAPAERRQVLGAHATSPAIAIRDANSAKERRARRDEAYRRKGEASNTEGYDRIEDNPFLAVRSNALSSFSIDVDRASYSNVRRFIAEGQRPPKDAVRIEELVNYFSYDYPDPRGAQPFSVTTDVSVAPWNREHRLVRIALHSKRVEMDKLPPNNLVFLIDVSGSMMPDNKLPLLKSALRLLVDQLREQDRVAIVVYAGNAGLVLPSTPGSDKRTILAALDRLEAGGSTAGGAGLKLAYDVAREQRMPNGNNRVILATDGDFNVGPSSDAEMIQLIEERRDQGTFLTVLGFGMGNLKDAKMEKLAGKGNGNYSYIDNLLEARKVLGHELGGTLLTVAKDVKLQVEFNPSHVLAYRLIGYENRLLRNEDFDDDRKDAGDLGAGHSVTALYEVIPIGSHSTTPIRGVDSLRYQTVASHIADSKPCELMYVKLRYKEPNGKTSRRFDVAVEDQVREPSTDFRFAAAVAAFGMILRNSEYKGTATMEDVIAMAKESLGKDREGYRAEFIRMVESVQSMLVAQAPERPR